MIALKAEDVKSFTTKLFCTGGFWCISGKGSKHYHLQQFFHWRTCKTGLLHRGGTGREPHRRVFILEDLKGLLFSLIKGKKSFLEVFVSCCSCQKAAGTEKFAARTGAGIEGSQIQGLYLNIRYDDGKMYCITGTSLNFSPWTKLWILSGIRQSNSFTVPWDSMYRGNWRIRAGRRLSVKRTKILKAYKCPLESFVYLPLSGTERPWENISSNGGNGMDKTIFRRNWLNWQRWRSQWKQTPDDTGSGCFCKGTGNTGGNGSCLCQAGEERDPDTDRGGRGGNRWQPSLDDADDNDESVSSIIGDKYRWSHNDSLDDRDNDDFTPSSAEEEEETTATSEQLLEGVASTGSHPWIFKGDRFHSAADSGAGTGPGKSANPKGTQKRAES